MTPELSDVHPRCYFEEVRNRGELTAIGAIFTPNLVLHVGGLPDIRQPRGTPTELYSLSCGRPPPITGKRGILRAAGGKMVEG